MQLSLRIVPRMVRMKPAQNIIWESFLFSPMANHECPASHGFRITVSYSTWAAISHFKVKIYTCISWFIVGDCMRLTVNCMLPLDWLELLVYTVLDLEGGH